VNARDRARVEAIRADDSSGATDIVLKAAELLLEAAASHRDLTELAQACADAQPSMAGLLCLEALVRDSPDPASALRRFREQVRRAPSAIARHAAELLLLGTDPSGSSRPPIRLVTCSSSRAVEATCEAVARQVPLIVCCAESRPNREGVELARRLASAGLEVRLFSDAGISAAIEGSHALVVGADAVGPETFINKAGTGALCARATAAGVPVYVLAGRDKFLSAQDIDKLRLGEGQPDQLLASPPPGVVVCNPLFEPVASRLISLLVTDVGSWSP
jgi:translation initiation factor 2B subunit (eIF-2B alpha/beta/delta family)